MTDDTIDAQREPAAETADADPSSTGDDPADSGTAAVLAPTAPPSRRSTTLVAALALIAIIAGGALFLSGWTLGRQAALTPGTPVDEAAAFQPFWDAYRAVSDRYAGGDVDRKTIIEGAIKGMIGALGDPYSMYMTSEEFKQSLRDISGEFEGIGATIGVVDAAGNTAACDKLGTDCRLAVVKPLPGSPAEKSGLQAGDVITKIDGTSLDGLTVDEARGKIRGPKDTAVVMTIERGGAAPRDIEIIRAVIITPEVTTETLADGAVGYIRLSGFSDHSAEALDAATAEAIAGGRKKLILDLRGNPGGFVTAAREVASQFLAGGTIFWQEDAGGNLVETVANPGGAATDPGIQLIVLVDGGSASASEIVAGALQDRGRAKLVGTQTFGKGTVQQWTQLESDSGGFRLTIAKWLTPDKTWIHGKGLTPDVVVDTQPQKPGDDPVLDKALELLGESPATGVLLRNAA